MERKDSNHSFPEPKMASLNVFFSSTHRYSVYDDRSHQKCMFKRPKTQRFGIFDKYHEHFYNSVTLLLYHALTFFCTLNY